MDRTEEYLSYAKNEESTCSLVNRSMELNDRKEIEKKSVSEDIVISVLFDMISCLDFEQKFDCESNKFSEIQTEDFSISECEKEDETAKEDEKESLEVNSKKETDDIVESVLADIIGSLALKKESNLSRKESWEIISKEESMSKHENEDKDDVKGPIRKDSPNSEEDFVDGKSNLEGLSDIDFILKFFKQRCEKCFISQS